MLRLRTAIIFLFYTCSLQAAPVPVHCDPGENYPIPENENGRMLFFVQRSLNSNTVIYDVNLDQQGRINTVAPVAVYWRRYNTDGVKKNLKWFESYFAYGIESEARGEGEFLMYFPSYSQKKARLYLNKANTAELEIVISGRKAKAYCAFVQLKDDEATIPQVRYIDLYGRDLETGATMIERLVVGDRAGRHSFGERK